MSIEVRNITKTFNGFAALKDVSLKVPAGQLVALLGPSGSGKTTLLRVIAGLEIPDRGVVLFDSEDATARSTRDRRVGFVFQHYALFRHMTVFENVAFGLRVKPRRERPSASEIAKRVHELLTLVQLERLAARYPSQLSGGQRQRVALARALAVQPKVLLLDEPFGALDAKVRQELRRWLRRLHDEIGITSVFVTHDQDEALEVADRVVILHEGRVEQEGSPEEVYEHPATPFVYRFLGNVNLFHGRVEGTKVHLGEFSMDAPEGLGKDAIPAVAYARPHLLDIDHQPPANRPHFRATIVHMNAAGAVVKIELATDSGGIINVEMPHERYRHLQLRKGATVFVSIKDMKVFTQAQSTLGGGI
ncbi:MAG: sulfate ABC transporter ATP-binding protein [Candidatus Omnitrophica bacterium]|nr:sulfate ABC transporter ATP-binding protein [Candidatus Omnitrophota bacterium]MBI2174425.1 sulfate ABC transporter ATP-binding protein [Candidatus Omnitrophota bacterium]MBI3010346.1 sulfate ABC transporter ATP-binding protein [Candidatus Omnitrophota bacterium]